MTEPTELHELGEDVPLCRLCVRRIYETCPLEPSENVAVCTEYAPFGGTPKAAGVVWVPSSDCTCPWKYCGETDRDENPPNPCSFGHRPVPRASAPTTCPTCGSDDPKVRETCVVSISDYSTASFPCNDSFHATPTPVSDDGVAILEELASHADEDRQSEAYREQKALCEAASDDAVREALERAHALETALRRRLPDGIDRAGVPLRSVGMRHEGDLLDIIATLETAIHQRDERIGELEGKE